MMLNLFYLHAFPTLASGYVAGDKLTGSKIIILINSLPCKRALNIIYLFFKGMLEKFRTYITFLLTGILVIKILIMPLDVHLSIKYPRLP
jgi:hypothetical protein